MKHFLVVAFLCIALNSGAQSISDAYYKSNPVWIELMNTPHVNYNEALRAFELYWANHEKPAGEHDMMSATEKEKASKSFARKKRQTSEAAVKYAVEYKQFMHWKEKMAPYVKPDGTVMDANDRLQYWETQQKNKR
jgi:hypothetical protein